MAIKMLWIIHWNLRLKIYIYISTIALIPWLRWLDVVVGLIHTCITVVYTLAVSHADKYPCANIEHKRAHSTHKSNHNLMIIKPQQQQINSSNSPKFYMHAHSWIKCYAWNYHDRRTARNGTKHGLITNIFTLVFPISKYIEKTVRHHCVAF